MAGVTHPRVAGEEAFDVECRLGFELGAVETGIAEVQQRRHEFLQLRNGPRELDSAVSEIFLGFQAAKSR